MPNINCTIEANPSIVAASAAAADGVGAKGGTMERPHGASAVSGVSAASLASSSVAPEVGVAGGGEGAVAAATIGGGGNRHTLDPWLHRWLYRLKTYFLLVHVVYILLIMITSAVLIYVSETYWGGVEDDGVVVLGGGNSARGTMAGAPLVMVASSAAGGGWGTMMPSSLPLSDNVTVASPALTFVDAVFVASSAVSCTGLSTVDVSKWNRFSAFVHNLATVLGGMVFTSGAMPLLRLYTLRKLQRETVIDDGDHYILVEWKERKAAFIHRLQTTAMISAAVTYGYFVFWHAIGILVFGLYGRVGGGNDGSSAPPLIPLSDAVEYTIAAFQNCGFVAMNPFASSTAIVFILGLLNAVGGALYPILLRVTFVLLLRVAWCVEALREWRRRRRGDGGGGGHRNQQQSLLSGAHGAMVDDEGGGGCGGGGEEDARTVRSSFFRGSFALHNSAFFGMGRVNADDEEDASDTEEDNEKGKHVARRDHQSTAARGNRMANRKDALVQQEDVWDSPSTRHLPSYYKGLLTIVHAREPSLYHFFLFSWHDTLYLAAAFVFINAAQMVPFLIQQWGGGVGGGGVLAPFPPAQKVLIALSQSILVRFSGTTLVDVLQFSNVHILWTLFAMYIPVVPIPNNERGRRQWKAMMKAGAMRLLTSRLFMLFVSASVIVWVEEDRLASSVVGTRFDIITRVLFETVSGYATSGMTLPLPSSAASFSSSFTDWGKLIIAANMLVGRHRWMDLGIDIGLDVLETSERQVEARIAREEEEGRCERYNHWDDAVGRSSGNGGGACADTATRCRRHRCNDDDGVADSPPMAMGSRSSAAETLRTMRSQSLLSN